MLGTSPSNQGQARAWDRPALQAIQTTKARGTSPQGSCRQSSTKCLKQEKKGSCKCLKKQKAQKKAKKNKGESKEQPSWEKHFQSLQDTPFKPFEGEGKGGSLGIPLAVAGPSRSPAGGGSAGNAGTKEGPPAPKVKTLKGAETLFDAGYFKFPRTPFWDGKDLGDVVKGVHCLWKGVSIGKNGGDSTRVDVFCTVNATAGMKG